METINKSSVMGVVTAAAVALTLTWSMSQAFVHSTAVARWVDAKDLAGGAVARVVDTAAARTTATSLLK
jgi:hypothetical protein